MIYLDNSATTKPCAEAVAATLHAMTEGWGNPSALYNFGIDAAHALRDARSKVAAAMGAEPDRVFFTSGGTEADNWALLGTVKRFGKRGKHIVTTAIEHHAILNCTKELEAQGYEVTYLQPDSFGRVTLDALKDALRSDTILVSIMMVNNETGAVMPIDKMAKLTHRICPNAVFHTDAVQGFLKVPFAAKTLGADLISVSSHKVHGPKGVGALYIKERAPIEALIRGGHQEHGLRAGTYNGPAIAAFGYAAELAGKELAEYASHTGKLRQQLKDGLLKAIPGIRINGHETKVLPNTLNVSFPGAEGEAILLYLDLLGVAASTGSACASASLDPSHVLMATGLGPELAHGSIRFSFGKYNTPEEVNFVLENFPPVIERLRKMSTVSYTE